MTAAGAAVRHENEGVRPNVNAPTDHRERPAVCSPPVLAFESTAAPLRTTRARTMPPLDEAKRARLQAILDEETSKSALAKKVRRAPTPPRSIVLVLRLDDCTLSPNDQF